MIEEIKNAAKIVEEMNRATEKKSKELCEQLGTIGFSVNEAQFQTAYDVEKVTGKVPELAERDSDTYPYEAFVVVDDFRFFAVLSTDEMEDYKNERIASTV